MNENPLAGQKDTDHDMTRKASSIVRTLERALAGKGMNGQQDYGIILAAHGWPNRDEVLENIAALKRLGDLPVCFDIPRGARRRTG